jgi:hypothetical protein
MDVCVQKSQISTGNNGENAVLPAKVECRRSERGIMEVFEPRKVPENLEIIFYVCLVKIPKIIVTIAQMFVQT